MIIRLSDLSTTGLIVNDTIPLEPLNERMNEGAENDIVFLDPPLVNVTINRTSHGAETSGTVKTRYQQPCSLCLKDLVHTVEINLNYILKPANAEYSDPDDGPGILYFDGKHIDLDDIIQESLIVSVEPYQHPPCNEDGTCTKCELNFKKEYSEQTETGNKFANLLSKAGVKAKG